MSEPKTWIVLAIWCDMQWDRTDYPTEQAAFTAAAQLRKDCNDATDILIIEPSGFIHELSKGKP